MIRDQIVEKCSSQTLTKKLLQQENLGGAKTVKTARNAETAVQEVRLLSQGHIPVSQIEAVNNELDRMLKQDIIEEVTEGHRSKSLGFQFSTCF